jgi:hypothetical protein
MIMQEPLIRLSSESQHPGFDADEGDGLGEREGGADLLAVLTGFERRGEGQIMITLRGGAALMDGGQAEIAGQAGGGRPGVHPGKLEGNQRQRQVLRPFNEAAMLRIKESSSDAALIECGQQTGLFGRPFVGIAPALGDQPGDRTARHGPGGLDEHGEVVPVGEAPHDLAQVVPGQRLERRRGFGFGGYRHK